MLYVSCCDNFLLCRSIISIERNLVSLPFIFLNAYREESSTEKHRGCCFRVEDPGPTELEGRRTWGPYIQKQKHSRVYLFGLKISK